MTVTRKRLTEVALPLKAINETPTCEKMAGSLNKPEDFILAIVELGDGAHRVRYLRRPFQREPDFGVTSLNCDLKGLWDRGEEPL